MGFPEPVLGERMHSYGVVLRGNPPKAKTAGWVEFLREVTKAIGMSPVYEPALWAYPVNGKGGQGQTIVLPISESFLALDTWPDHRGAYLFVCSCKPFDGYVIDAVARQHGLAPNESSASRFYAELSLK